MSPRLVIVAGPSRGAQVALETDEVALGRDSSCGVCLPDAALSRRHALLERSPDGWRIRDLGSLNGLRVNGLPTAEHLLSDGDRIELGVSVLVFRPEPEGAEGGAKEAAEVVSTIRVPVSQAVWAGDAAALASRKVERSLGLLLAAGRRFAAERTVEGLAKALLSSSRDVAGGTSGAVLVPDDGNGLREVAAQGSPRSPRVPPVAAAEALERREAVALGLDGLHGAALDPGRPDPGARDGGADPAGEREEAEDCKAEHHGRDEDPPRDSADAGLPVDGTIHENPRIPPGATWVPGAIGLKYRASVKGGGRRACGAPGRRQ